MNAGIAPSKTFYYLEDLRNFVKYLIDYAEQETGYRIIVYRKIAEFLTALETNEPDGVILDLMMDEQGTIPIHLTDGSLSTGLEVYRLFSKKHPNVPVGVLTGLNATLPAGVKVKNAFNTAQVRFYLQKPVDPDLFVLELKKLAQPIAV